MLLKKCLHCDKIPGGKQLTNMKHRDSRVLKDRQVLSSSIRTFPKEGVSTGVHGVWIVWRASVVAAHSLCGPTSLFSLLWGLYGPCMEDLSVWGGDLIRVFEPEASLLYVVKKTNLTPFHYELFSLQMQWRNRSKHAH